MIFLPLYSSLPCVCWDICQWRSRPGPADRKWWTEPRPWSRTGTYSIDIGSYDGVDIGPFIRKQILNSLKITTDYVILCTILIMCSVLIWTPCNKALLRFRFRTNLNFFAPWIRIKILFLFQGPDLFKSGIRMSFFTDYNHTKN